MKTVKLLLAVALLAQFGCDYRGSISGDYIGSFDISRDDSTIIFTLGANYRTSIYQIGTDGKNLRCLIAANPDSNFYSPRYSKDNSKIIFIGHSLKTGKTYIYLANSDGSGRKIITHGNEMPFEAFLSECKDEIYYTRFSDFTNGSPLVNQQPHGADIYVIDSDGNSKKLTNLNAYQLFSISEFDCDRLLADMSMPRVTKGPMILISRNSGDTVGRIYPSPLEDLSLAHTPYYSKPFNVTGFIVPYELHLIDMATEKAHMVIRQKNNPIYEFHFFKTQKRISYVTENEMKFYIVNFDGSNLKEVVVGNVNTTENIMRVKNEN